MKFNDYYNYVFDYDGTLIDSMEMWYGFSSDFIKSLGYKPKSDLDNRVKYLSLYDTAIILKDEYNMDDSIDDIMQKINDYIYLKYRTIKLKDNAIKLLDALKNNGKRIYILSATPTELLKMNMEYNNILGYFNRIYSSSDLRLSKEDGSAFKYVLGEINGNYLNTIVIEDSVPAMDACIANDINILMVSDFSNKNNQKYINSKGKKLYNLSMLYKEAYDEKNRNN